MARTEKSALEDRGPQNLHKHHLRVLVPFSPLSKFTQDQKISACKEWIKTGSVEEAAAKIGATAAQVHDWKKRDWWLAVADQILEDQKAKLDSQLTRLLEKAVEEIADRLEHGDEKVTAKGEKVRHKVSTRDLATAVFQTIFDKRQLIRGEATSRSETTSSSDRLKELAKQFETISKGRLIEGEAVSVEEGQLETD